MVILGLLLVVLGALAVVAALFTTSGSTNEFLGVDNVGAIELFFLGLAAGVAILWGFSITKFGTKRQLRHRREQRKLDDLQEKLDRAEQERVIERERDEDRPSL